jgi:hydroxymethylpyrimidine/phosphomethylpyrimidine kinase
VSTVWLIGGHDPTGGAGIDRDRWALERVAPALRPLTIETAATEQGDGRPARVHPVSPAALADHLSRAEERAPAAIKIGLVPPSLVDVVDAALARWVGTPVVFDPVLGASDGGPFSTPLALLGLWPRASVATPNFSEACELAGTDELDAIVGALGGIPALLVKSLPSPVTEVCDLICVAGTRTLSRRRRRPGPTPRGTGCALATAIAAHLAEGQSLLASVQCAQRWLDEARARTVPGPDGRPHLS